MGASRGGALRDEPVRRLFFALWPDHADQLILERASRDNLHQLAAFSPGQTTSSPRPASRFVPASNYHVTLVFLGSVLESRLALLSSVAQEVSRDACHRAHDSARRLEERTSAPELILDRIEYWRKARVLCATTSERPRSSAASPHSVSSPHAVTSPHAVFSPHAALADHLRRDLLASGFTPDLKPFRAHVTLARKVVMTGSGARLPYSSSASQPYTGCPLAMQTVLWRFTQFSLIESRTAPSGSLYSVLDSWPLCTESAQMSGKNTQ